MKRVVLLAGLLVLCAGMANGVDFRVEFGPEWTPGKIERCDNEIRVYMHNTPGEGARMGYSLPFMIYGEVDSIGWLDYGGVPETGGALVINEDFGPGGTFFPSVNTINIFSPESWDGHLPDTFNHTTTCIPITGCPGWVDDIGEQLVYVMHFEVYGGFLGDPRQLCIDSIGHSNPTYDWLWTSPSGPFGGPYCIDVEVACPSPWFVDCPASSEIITRLGETFELPLQTEALCQQELTEAITDLGSVEIIDPTPEIGEVLWSLSPDSSMLGTHEVSIRIGTAVHPVSCYTTEGTACRFTVHVLNHRPTIYSACGDTVNVCIGTSMTVGFTASDPDSDPLTYVFADDAEGRATLSASKGLVTFSDSGEDGEAVYEVVVAVYDHEFDSTFCTMYFNVYTCCGDCNDDGVMNLLDILDLIDYMYGDPIEPPIIPELSDANDDGAINLLDLLQMIAYLYSTPSGPAPVRCPQ
ncbi:MAG: hypothetical protein JW763_09815 [candidate division Zixibacteria bacterium]|nr:hypothetical protein [candidate division Zixibacteria bacterium]